MFVERLAALVPAPQKNQVHYHGVFASAHRWRSLIVPDGVRRKKKAKARKQSGKPPGFDERWVPWEELLYRVFGRDVVSCPACGSRIWLVDHCSTASQRRDEVGVLIPSTRGEAQRRRSVAEC